MLCICVGTLILSPGVLLWNLFVDTDAEVHTLLVFRQMEAKLTFLLSLSSL